jgi:hypothetical protein
MTNGLTTAEPPDQFSRFDAFHAVSDKKKLVVLQGPFSDRTLVTRATKNLSMFRGMRARTKSPSKRGRHPGVEPKIKDPKHVAFAERLRVAMIEADIPTMEHLATEIGLAAGTVRMWGNGGSICRVPDAVRLRERFGVTLDWLYLGITDGLAEPKRIRLAAVVAGVPLPSAVSEAPQPESGVIPALRRVASKARSQATGRVAARGRPTKGS